MELFVLLLIAGIGGYWLANSRFSKKIDNTGERVVGVTRNAADKAEDGVRRIFRRKPARQDTVIEGQAVDAPPAEVAPAEKQASRRKEE